MPTAGPVEGISPLRAETVTEDMGFGHLDAWVGFVADLE
jgi:hypothetical protein